MQLKYKGKSALSYRVNKSYISFYEFYYKSTPLGIKKSNAKGIDFWAGIVGISNYPIGIKIRHEFKV